MNSTTNEAKYPATTMLPSLGHLTKMSTATCANVFDELEMALLLLDAGRPELNPVQRELASRFITTCKTFARDILAAEGNSNALRMVFGLPLINKVDDQARQDPS
jgi:hypothetical protein